MKNIPNLFTLLNLFFGCLAVILILQNGITVLPNSDGSQYIGMPEKTEMASLFIGLAALVDFLDGLVARLFKATSPMGKELDSLADVVSFGVAPGMILYQLLRMSFASQADGLDVSCPDGFCRLCLSLVPQLTGWPVSISMIRSNMGSRVSRPPLPGC